MSSIPVFAGASLDLSHLPRMVILRILWHIDVSEHIYVYRDVVLNDLEREYINKSGKSLISPAHEIDECIRFCVDDDRKFRVPKWFIRRRYGYLKRDRLKKNRRIFLFHRCVCLNYFKMKKFKSDGKEIFHWISKNKLMKTVRVNISCESLSQPSKRMGGVINMKPCNIQVKKLVMDGSYSEIFFSNGLVNDFDPRFLEFIDISGLFTEDVDGSLKTIFESFPRIQGLKFSYNIKTELYRTIMRVCVGVSHCRLRTVVFDLPFTKEQYDNMRSLCSPSIIPYRSEHFLIPLLEWKPRGIRRVANFYVHNVFLHSGIVLFADGGKELNLLFPELRSISAYVTLNCMKILLSEFTSSPRFAREEDYRPLSNCKLCIVETNNDLPEYFSALQDVHVYNKYVNTKCLLKRLDLQLNCEDFHLKSKIVRLISKKCICLTHLQIHTEKKQYEDFADYEKHEPYERCYVRRIKEWKLSKIELNLLFGPSKNTLKVIGLDFDFLDETNIEFFLECCSSNLHRLKTLIIPFEPSYPSLLKNRKRLNLDNLYIILRAVRYVNDLKNDRGKIHTFTKNNFRLNNLSLNILCDMEYYTSVLKVPKSIRDSKSNYYVGKYDPDEWNILDMNRNYSLDNDNDDKLKKIKKICGYCGKSSEQMNRCSGCKKINYCTSEHQNKHWKRHKKLCKLICSKK